MKAFPSERLFQQGMDLRDYFAIEYVNGIISNPNFDATLSFDEVVKNGYEMADAMMEERKQKVPFDNTPSVKEINDVLNTLMLDDIDTTLRKVATLAWTRAFKKGQGK
jgi:hypothetical protein